MAQKPETRTKVTELMRWSKRSQVFPFLVSSQERCDMLEILQSIDLDDLNQFSLTELVRACDVAIKTYTVCSGYAKHWKYYKEEMLKRIKHDTKMNVYDMRVTSYDLPAVLHKAGVISKISLYKLEAAALNGGNLLNYLRIVNALRVRYEANVVLVKKGTPYISNQNEWKITFTTRKLQKCLIEKYSIN